MKFNPRNLLVAKVQIEVQEAILKVVKDNPSLTYHELQNILIGIAQQWNKQAIRNEREESNCSTQEMIR